MAPYAPPALPFGLIEIPISPEEKALGLTRRLVRPDVRLEAPKHRRRVPIDAESEVPEVEIVAARPALVPVAKKADLDVHRAVLDDAIRAKIIRLFTAAEPMTIRQISQRFGISYKCVWSVVQHLQKPKPPQPRRPKMRGKRRLGLAWAGSLKFAKPLQRTP